MEWNGVGETDVFCIWEDWQVISSVDLWNGI